MIDTRIGVVGGAWGAFVTRTGVVRPERVEWELDWWIGADDRWHLPEREVAVRQTRVDDMPVVQTAMRVPGADAVQRAYAVRTGSGDVAVIEIANESPGPFVVALVVRGATGIDLDGHTVYADGAPALHLARPPSRWVLTGDGTTEEVVTTGRASDTPFVSRRDRDARLVAAFLAPVAHRTALRAMVPLERPHGELADPRTLPNAADVARGWRAQLDRAMRVTVPDPNLQRGIDAARAATLLDGQARKPEPAVVTALEDWGFDAEAAAGWLRLSGRKRRRAARRARTPRSWENVRAARDRDAHGELLHAVRAMLVDEVEDHVALMTGWPEVWRGQPLDVRGAPTRRGPVSFSVRWHGERPALLWEVPEGTRVRAPGLDTAWSTTESCGEVLLSARVGDAEGRDLPRS